MNHIFITLLLVFSLFPSSSLQTAESYQIDPAHAFVTFTISHFVTGKARGAFKDVSGTIVYDEKDISKSSVEVVIKGASINTNNENRDRHLRSADFFDVEKYPELIFKSKRIERSGGGFLAIGDLTIHGVTKEVSMPFKLSTPFKDPLPVGSKRMLVETGLKIDRRDFGISWSRLMEGGGLFVGNEVTIDINVEAYIPKARA